MIDKQKMVAQLVLHEGISLRPYVDTTGNVTIGVGYNITSRTMQEFERVIGRFVETATDHDVITRDEAMQVLAADVDRLEKATALGFPEYLNLDPIRQRVVIDMAFNLGYRVLEFKNAIAAVKARDWSRAARELYKSRWATQVGAKTGQRADRLAQMILTGRECPELKEKS